MEATGAESRSPISPALLIVPALVGGAVAVALGVYGREHDPTGQSILGDGLFFSATLNMKAWLATAAILLAVYQLVTALWMYGKLPFGGEPPSWIGKTHRASGTLAFIFSLPVAYHCLWALGFQDATTRPLLHSLAGCFFYGAFAAKVLIVHSNRMPGIALPLAGGALVTGLSVIWLTSALWFFQNIGFPAF